VWCFHVNNLAAQQVVASGIKSIAAGGNYHGGLAAIKSSDGSVLMGYPWSLTPHPTLTGVTQMALGANHACALMADTSVQCMGYDYYNQRGDGQIYNWWSGDSYTSLTTVKDVNASALTGAAQISAANEGTCVMKTGGAVVCFGSNYEGEMGNGTQGGPTPSTIAVNATSLTQATGIVSGYYHTYAMQNAGGLFAWGSNGQGQTAISPGGNVTSPTLLGL
ncbi:MAG TPA: hypothetical protein VF316_02035, partial [Polyangiaceae bacterium]